MECKEFSEGRKLIRKSGCLAGAEKWDIKEVLLLGKQVEGVDREMMDVIDGWLLKELLIWWKRRRDLLGWV